MHRCLLSATLLLSGGCATLYDQEISVPQPVQPVAQVATHYFNVDALKLHVQPRNPVVLYRTQGVAPQREVMQYDPFIRLVDAPFYIDLFLASEVAGYIIDTDKLSLALAGRDYPAKLVKYPEPGEAVVDRYVFTDYQPAPALPCRVVSGGNMPVSARVEVVAGAQWTCLRLLFDVPVPSPKKVYTLHINGLSRQSQPLAPQAVSFSYHRGNYPYILP